MEPIWEAAASQITISFLDFSAIIDQSKCLQVEHWVWPPKPSQLFDSRSTVDLCVRAKRRKSFDNTNIHNFLDMKDLHPWFLVDSILWKKNSQWRKRVIFRGNFFLCQRIYGRINSWLPSKCLGDGDILPRYDGSRTCRSNTRDGEFRWYDWPVCHWRHQSG